MAHPSPDPEAVFNEVFCARTRAARRARRLSRIEMARRLGVSRAVYAKYEARTPLPHELVEDFVELTGTDYDELFAGIEMDGRAETPRSA